MLAAVAISIACARTDARLSKSVERKLAAESIPKGTVTVGSRDRVVTISGTLATPAAKDQALRAARETPGVRSVVDELRVATGPGATPGAVSTTAPTSLTGDMPGGGRSPAATAPTTAGSTGVPPPR